MGKDFAVKVVKIEEVKDHPNADLLVLYRVLGWWVVSLKDLYQVGDLAIYFPPNSVVPKEWTDKWDITKYCAPMSKATAYHETHVRIRAARFRGESSFGYLSSFEPEFPHWITGTDVTKFFNTVKYEPPEVTRDSSYIEEWPNFIRYTDIENLANDPDAFFAGENVSITEKIHGTNSRVGYIKNPKTNKMEFVSGSHVSQLKLRHKLEVTLFNKFKFDFCLPFTENKFVNKIYTKLENIKNNKKRIVKLEFKKFHETYSLPFKLYEEKLIKMIKEISYHKDYGMFDVIVYGEIFGPGVQDMHYGRLGKDYRVFDICCQGQYMSVYDLRFYLSKYEIPSVPVLYEGPYNNTTVTTYVDGPTTMTEPKNILKGKYKGREGVVIKSIDFKLKSDGHRKIYKSISADYFGRADKDATEFH